MEKSATTAYPVHDLFRRRWSPRAFADRTVPQEALQCMLEAARWSASSFNEQPWRYIVATREQPADFQAMLACLEEKNQAWAKGAPVLMLSFYKKTFSHNKAPNRVALHDVGAASAQLTMEALAHDLFVHQMGGIKAEKIRETYKVPDDFEPVAALAIGYMGDLQQLPEAFRKSEVAARARKNHGELFFSGRWDQPAAIFK